MTINLTDPANHPANGPLTAERITRVRDELQRTMFYANGGVIDHIVVDAIKALEELLVRRGGEPEVLPCPVLLEPGLRLGKGVKTQLLFDALTRRAEYYAELDAMTPEQRAEHDAGVAEFKAMLAGNSPVTTDCWCRTCRPVTMTDMRFVVCPECGNKRCPHANDHNNACTGSNEPGQIGSAYPAAPQEVK